MSMKRQTVLGQRGFEVIRSTGHALKATEEALGILTTVHEVPAVCEKDEREIAARVARRARLDADIRPTPGTSELLANIEGEFRQGSRTVPVHDLTRGRLVPVHLVRRRP